MPAFYEAFQQCPEIKSSHGLKRGSRKLDILRSLSEKRGQRGCIRMTGLQRDVKWSKPSKPLAQPPTPALSSGITVSTIYTDSTLLVFSIPTMSSQETCIPHQVLGWPHFYSALQFMMHQPWRDEKSPLVTVACWRISEQETFSILPLPSKAHHICSEQT